MRRRFTLGQLMLIVGAVGLEFGLLPVELAVVTAGVTLALPMFPPAGRWAVLGVAAMTLVLLPLLFSHPHDVSPSALCMNNLRQIGLALLYYEEKYGSLPPAYVCDAEGRPMHSWRVLILPGLDSQGLYDAYNFNQPWDGPDNSRLAAEMPHVYRCPASRWAQPDLTDYVVLVGPGTAFPGRRSASTARFRDPKGRTILVTESGGAPIPWMKPSDLDFGDPSRVPPPVAPHNRRLAVVFADGSTDRLAIPFPAETWRAMASVSGGEVIAEP